MKMLVGLPETVFEGEAGGYYSWMTAYMPALADSNVGAGRLVLHHRGFAIPHYADSTKIAFVLQGCGVAGLISIDGQKETVVRLKKGAALTLTKGDVSWWYNPGDSLLEVVVIGETSDAIVPGEFTYNFLSGTNGMLNSFTPDFLAKIYNMTDQEASRLASSQPGTIGVKLRDGTGPEAGLPLRECFNFCEEFPELQVPGGGSIKRFRSGKDDIWEETGPALGAELSAFEIKLKPKGALPPLYMAKSATQVFYVVKGKVWVQIVSGNGGMELDQQVEAGRLFVVPKFYMVAMVAGDEGLECVSLMTTSEPVVGQLSNIWRAMSRGALEAALNLTPEDVKAYSSKIENASIIKIE